MHPFLREEEVQLRSDACDAHFAKYSGDILSVVIIIIIFTCPIIQQYTHLHGYGLEEQDSKV